MLRPYQTRLLEELRTSLRDHKRVLAVLPTGGGKTKIFCEIAAAARARGHTVQVLVHRRELVDQTPDPSVQTIQSWTPNGADLVIVDEAHHACALSWADKLRGCERLLGFTATPQRLDGNGLDGIFGRMVEGPNVARLMADGFLSQFRLFAPPGGVDIKGVANAVKNWKLLAPGRQTIGFCVSLAHMQTVAAAFEAEGVHVGCINGRMAKAARDEVVRQFKEGKLRILLSVELISEGFDVPACDCVLLMRPTKSLAMYLQQVGRGLRPSNKECVILDCVGNSAHHGMPDEERIWSLQGHAKIRNGLVANAPVRVCSRCFGVHRPHLRVCPFCGFSHPLDKRIPTDLELILEQKRQMKRDVGRARSVGDLERIAKERGYSRGWIYRLLAARNRRGT